ncbi:hypothetical protein ABPG74_004143 [Tetrahymena malaccensis]
MIYLNRTILLIHQLINLDNEFSLARILFESEFFYIIQLYQKQQIFSILNNHIYQQANSNQSLTISPHNNKQSQKSINSNINRQMQALFYQGLLTFEIELIQIYKKQNCKTKQ